MKTQAQSNEREERVHVTHRLQSSYREEGRKQEQGGFLAASLGSLNLLCSRAHNHLLELHTVACASLHQPAVRKMSHRPL